MRTLTEKEKNVLAAALKALEVDCKHLKQLLQNKNEKIAVRVSKEIDDSLKIIASLKDKLILYSTVVTIGDGDDNK